MYKGTTVRVLPYETCSADVNPIQADVPKHENVLAVHNIPETKGLNATAALAKVVAAAKVQYKAAEDSQNFILH